MALHNNLVLLLLLCHTSTCNTLYQNMILPNTMYAFIYVAPQQLHAKPGKHNCNWPSPACTCHIPATYVYAMSLTDGSPLPNDLPCSAVNDFILDNILQLLIQTTTPAIIDDPYYYTCMTSSLDQNYCHTTSKS